MTPRRPEIPPAEEGFALIEVLVSALVILIISTGTFGLLEAMTRASGDQRSRAQAYAIAQEDQARLRSMQLVALNHLDESRALTLGGTTFTVRSTGVFINSTTSTVSCTGENTSADYARVNTAVTWPGMEDEDKTVLRSIVSPANSSIDPNNGTLTVSVTNEKGEPRAGVDLKAGVYSAESNAEGCATFPNLVQGTHNLESRGEDAKMVSPNSNYVEVTQAGVGAGSAKVTKLIYDNEGSIPVKFKYRVGSSGEFKPTFASTIIVSNAVMKEAKVFGTPAGPRLPEFLATPLFPFTSSYSVYAGCVSNKPSAGPAMPSAIVPVGGAAPPTEVQLPALDLTVKEGTKVIKGAKVTITDKTGCKDSSGNAVKRSYTTNSEGKQTSALVAEEKQDPGLPWGTYEVCASAKVSSAFRRKKINPVLVQSLTGATALTIDLTSGTWENNVECT